MGEGVRGGFTLDNTRSCFDRVVILLVDFLLDLVEEAFQPRGLLHCRVASLAELFLRRLVGGELIEHLEDLVVVVDAGLGGGRGRH